MKLIAPLLSVFCAFALFGLAEEPAAPTETLAKPKLKCLLITGGCCHNYEFQSKALTNGVAKHADVEWTVVNQGGKGTSAKIPFYDNKDWAEGYDVVVHNECFATTTDKEYINKITKAHGKDGKPAVVIHCAMHTYRDAKDDEWRKFLGVTSRKHDHQAEYPVKITKPNHPIMRDVPDNWVTQKDELYIVEKEWPGMTPLATSKSERDKKDHTVIWVNDYEGSRVFGTTYGHSDATFRDEVFLDLVSQGLLWAAGKLEDK